MAFEYKGTLIKDPITGKLRYDNPQALPTSTGAGYMLPKQEQKIIRDSNGLPAMQTTSPYPIHQQPALKIHPMTTPEAAGFPALPNGGVSQEAVPTGIAGYFGAADKRGKIALDPQSGVATGGFARPKDAEANLAAEDAQYKLARDVRDRRTALDFADNINSMQTRLQSAIASENRTEATMLSDALRASSGIQPYDASKMAQVEATKATISSDTALKKEQANLIKQQADMLPQINALKAATAMAEAKSKMGELNAKYLEAVLKSGDPNAIEALGSMPQFKDYVAAYMAAKQMDRG